MNLQDRIMETLLAALDRLLDKLSRGRWSRWHASILDRKWRTDG